MGKKHCEIILGTYEEFIVGYKYTANSEESEQTFAVHSHAASIRCMANFGNLLASGGTDDRIIVYDLRTRKEHCLLNHHNGTINCLQFTNDHTHLISGGQDGLLAIVRVGSWQIEKAWEKAHQGFAVLDIAVHPSGKLALTLGADATLRTWNLIKGRQAYIINLNSKSKDARNLQGVKWAADGVRFVLIGSKSTDVWSIETGGVLQSIDHSAKITSCIWHMISDDKLVVGYEDGNVAIVIIETGAVIVHKAHESRVKCMSMFRKNLITASSSGEIKVWSKEMKPLCVISGGCRFTCMCVIPGDCQQFANDPPQQIVDEAVTDVADANKVEADQLNNSAHSQNSPSKRKKEIGVSEKKKKKTRKISSGDISNVEVPVEGVNGSSKKKSKKKSNV